MKAIGESRFAQRFASRPVAVLLDNVGIRTESTSF
jgi:hypothetical protein